jgi:hypothetical protein
MVIMLASGPQDRGFNPGRSRRIFQAKKSSARLPSEGKKNRLSHVADLRHVKDPGNYMEIGFSGEIFRPFLAHFRSSLPEGSQDA